MERKIEQLRYKLFCLVEVNGNLIDGNVVLLSQELDVLLLKYELQKKSLRCNKRRITA